MTVTALLLLTADLAAILLLAFGMFLPRHHRRDLAGAFLVVNLGVYAVAAVLSASDAALGVGLGLFGVLSIIRLRSSEISQHEIAYYFAALALGLVAGLSTSLPLLQLALLGLVLLAVYLGDHPRLSRRSRRLLLVLDRAVLDEGELREHIETITGGRVRQATVLQSDLVEDTTRVDVRLVLSEEPAPAVPAPRRAHERGRSLTALLPAPEPGTRAACRTGSEA